MVINTDAMQVYDVLRRITARPSPEEMGGVPHLLYGTVPPSRRFSTGDWLRAVKGLLDDPTLAGRPLIFVGGTGLYSMPWSMALPRCPKCRRRPWRRPRRSWPGSTARRGPG